MQPSYVIEIGTKSGEGEFEQWDSDGFYAGYHPNGGPIILVPAQAEAFRFPDMERAQRIPSGDTRIQQRHRILKSELAPNV